MEPVLVGRRKLLGTLRANRDQHVEDYEEAVKGWRVKCSEAWRKFAKKAQEQATRIATGKAMLMLDTPHMPKPTNFKKAYDQVIGMLELSVEDNVKLDAKDYERYVRDQWEWSESFNNATTTYAGGGGGGGSKLLRKRK